MSEICMYLWGGGYSFFFKVIELFYYLPSVSLGCGCHDIMIKEFVFITSVHSMLGNLSSTQKKNSRLHHEIKIMKITCVEEIIDCLQCFSLFLKIICVFFFAGGGRGNEISSVKV